MVASVSFYDDHFWGKSVFIFVIICSSVVSRGLAREDTNGCLLHRGPQGKLHVISITAAAALIMSGSPSSIIVLEIIPGKIFVPEGEQKLAEIIRLPLFGRNVK